MLEVMSVEMPAESVGVVPRGAQSWMQTVLDINRYDNILGECFKNKL